MSTPRAGRPGYRYVGPEHVRAAVRAAETGTPVRTAADFARWAAARSPGELAEPFTFVIGTDGVLRLAPRRSEHVACAGGDRVLSAGEISFRCRTGADGRWGVREVSNQSTGYCPDTVSWPAVARALDAVGLDHPDCFTHGIVFRRCPACQEHNIVRDGHFACVFCDTDLPRHWNVDL
ncbi:hypothetical protein HYE82_30290 [Streptomyces sp. BR123]|uniref:hypothetical protein n=1 Tax=Streptomyces sp. BR123 TaxID=2749828 RepID=UPI0015C4D463|nr:hypothetical protein [Streptomyces sp. BR123]NXY98595.1 hypothetical protein [Streptomyces sp. BR123]